jgi:hypothetical protein
MIMKKISLSIVLISIVSLSFAQSSNTFVKSIEKAVKLEKFQKQEAISFDIDLIFGGKSSLKGKVMSATNSAWVKLIKDDGTTILFDGEHVWITPAAKNNSRARFDVFTWQYFFMATFKLSDPGTVWENLGTIKYAEDTQLPASKLTFKSGTGDASDDYYVVYKNKENLIKAMGYIVTFGGKAVADAEKSAHAIVYEDYKNINGVNIAHQWYFHNWNIENGIADQIGEAKITNVTFLKAEDVPHQKPDGAVEVKLK